MGGKTLDKSFQDDFVVLIGYACILIGPKTSEFSLVKK